MLLLLSALNYHSNKINFLQFIWSDSKIGTTLIKSLKRFCWLLSSEINSSTKSPSTKNRSTISCWDSSEICHPRWPSFTIKKLRRNFQKWVAPILYRRKNSMICKLWQEPSKILWLSQLIVMIWAKNCTKKIHPILNGSIWTTAHKPNTWCTRVRC